MGTLDGKAALVTGASRGIGRAIAQRLGREGARVVVNYVGDAAAAQMTVDAVKAAGGDAVAVQADTSDPKDIRRLFEQADAAFGGLDILVNNAHKGSGSGAIAELDEAPIDEQLAVLKGYVLCMQEGARRLRDGGAIVNISSSTTHMAMPGNALYSATKAAIDQLGRVLSREIAPRGITVNAVAPGRVDTDRVRGMPDRRPPGPETPFNRQGQPDEVAEVVYFLVSPGGRWMNTQTLLANGGMVFSQ